MTSPNIRIVLALFALTLAACGGDATSDTAEQPAVKSYKLEADLTDAANVYAARKKGEGDEVIVVGRVRQELEGSAAFMLVDEVLEYCGQGLEKCGCPTPWDYCCIEQEVVAEASLPVEIHNAKGEVVDLAKDDIRLLDLVAMKGTLAKTESGDLFLVVKDGWFLRERPKIEGDIDWP